MRPGRPMICGCIVSNEGATELADAANSLASQISAHREPCRDRLVQLAVPSNQKCGASSRSTARAPPRAVHVVVSVRADVVREVGGVREAVVSRSASVSGLKSHDGER